MWRTGRTTASGASTGPARSRHSPDRGTRASGETADLRRKRCRTVRQEWRSIRPARPEFGQGLRIAGHDRVVVGLAEGGVHEAQGLRVVVDHEDARPLSPVMGQERAALRGAGLLGHGQGGGEAGAAPRPGARTDRVWRCRPVARAGPHPTLEPARPIRPDRLARTMGVHLRGGRARRRRTTGCVGAARPATGTLTLPRLPRFRPQVS